MSKTAETIPELLKASFERRGSARLIDCAGALSFGELDELASAFARALMAAGLESGDRVAIAAANSRWCAAAYVGTWKAGAVPVGINPSLTPPEIAHILGHATPKAAMVDVGKLDDFRKANELADTPVEDIFSDEATDGATAMSSLPSADQAWPAVVYPEIAALLYTSGTTGRSKGVMLTQGNLVFVQKSWREVFKTEETDVVYCGLPLFHVYALVVVFLRALTSGHDIVLEQGFPFPGLLERIAEHRVTYLPSAPVLFRALTVLDWDPSQYDLSSLRLLLSGGAPVDRSTVTAVTEKLGCAEFQNGYGITECGPMVALGPMGTAAPPGATGRPVPGVEVEIRNSEGEVLAPNELGEICVRSPGVMKGYYRDPEATAEVLVDGWYRTGDVGHIDDAGYVYVSDRIKDMIIVNGENVYPREVEAALLEHPNIAAAAVARMPSEASGESPLAFVVLKDATGGPGVAELLTFLRERLAAYKLPGKFEFVEALPTSASGKILKRELHQQ